MHDADGEAALSNGTRQNGRTAASTHLPQGREDSARVSVNGPTSDVIGGEGSRTADEVVMDDRKAMSAMGSGGSEVCDVFMPPADKWCRPPPGASWVNRLVIRATTPIAACHNCEGATRARCRGCMRMMCIACAKCQNKCREEAPADIVR